MPTLINESARPIHILGAMLVPGDTVEVADDYAKKPFIKVLIESGDLGSISVAKKVVKTAPDA